MDMKFSALDTFLEFFFFFNTNSRFKCINLFELQIKWKAKKGDETNGGYSHSVLQSLLHKVGTYIVTIIK